MQKVGRNVYIETGFHGCNVSFIDTRAGVVMIDTPQVPYEAVKWRDQIAKHGKVQYVINNEPHIDHVAGNYFFDGVFVSHEGSREAILKTPISMIQDMLKRVTPDSLPLPDDFYIRTPDITCSQDMTIYLGDHTFKLLLLPGHTPYQLVTYCPEERVVFTSDNVVTGGQPFLHQAVPFAWLESLQKIQSLDVDTIVPGHGSLCNKSYIPQLAELIQTWIKIIQDALKKGMTSEEAQNKIRLQDYFPNLPDDDFMRPMRKMFIAHLYEVLKK